jgi:hypothetical protein
MLTGTQRRDSRQVHFSVSISNQSAPNLSHRQTLHSAHRLVPYIYNRTFHHNFPSPLLIFFHLYFFLLIVGVRTFFVSKRILVVATIILVLGKFIRIIEKRIVFGCIFNMERASVNPSSYRSLIS